MKKITSQEEFRAAVKSFMAANSIGPTELARRTGESRKKVENWTYYGIKTQSKIDAVVAQYPWLFESNGNVPQEVPTEGTGAKGNTAPVPLHPDRKLLGLIKTEQVRLNILCLAATLEWFLFEASAEERHLFRDTLGDSWKDFVWLTRAMIGEAAFEIAQQDGRPKGGV